MFVLSDYLKRVLAIDPAADVLEFDGRWLTWGALDAQVTAIRELLTGLGLGADSRVGIMVRNRPDAIAAILAALTLDACFVSINPLLPEARLNADLATLKLPVIIGEADDFARPGVVPLLREEGTAGIVMTPFLGGAAIHPELAAITGQDLRRDSPGTFVEMLTSGTTGTPKRIPLMAANFSRSILDAAAFEKRDPGEGPRLSNAVTILNTPFAHIGGHFGLFNTLSAGRKGCMLDRFRVDEFVDAVQRHKPKVAGAPPAALRMILDAGVPKEALASLTAFRTSTAPLDPALADQFYEHFGIPVLQNYGATEFGGVAGWTLGDFRKSGKKRRGSVGKMLPNVEGRVVDQDTGEPLPYGEVGLLELRAKHLGDGVNWLRTTDLARMDEEQFLWIVGRADNAINRGGLKIAPDDV
ncbi:MAG: long-chain fatty acid--CoA ligase, partial [Sphingomonadales bacterium]|nr:long-chain fatty acid--CoA ligase [Sphingomonadales bacterium]